jgi:hypothetical protein
MTSPLKLHDLDTFVSTRDALHRVAEHVVAKARYVDDGGIRLTAYPGGFATPLLSGERRVRVDDGELVVDEGDHSRRVALTTVAESAAFVGVEPGFPTQLYQPATALEPDAPLHIDLHSATELGAWYGFTAEVLEKFSVELAADPRGANPSPLILWPEHFDQAISTEDGDQSRRANYGASPGDEGHPEPYLYVGPWAPVPPDAFWNADHFNGAVLSLSDVVDSEDPRRRALDFLRQGRALLVAPDSEVGE